MSHNNESFLGQQVVYNDDEGTLIHQSGGPGGHGPHGGGGGTAPPPTLVGASGGLQFDLIWDSSVAKAPTGFQTAVANTVSYLASLYATPEVVNIHIGWGEVNGQSLSPGAIGESQTNGYLTNYSTVTSHLIADGYSFNASNEPTGAQFFISNAQAKSFGILNA